MGLVPLSPDFRRSDLATDPRRQRRFLAVRSRPRRCELVQAVSQNGEDDGVAPERTEEACYSPAVKRA